MPDPVQLLTVDEVAAWLRVEPRYVYRMTSAGTLPKVYVGRYLRVPASSVADYIASRTVEAVKRVPRPRRPGARARRLRAVNHGE
jgi:excisionase family DNA binding protein